MRIRRRLPATDRLLDALATRGGRIALVVVFLGLAAFTVGLIRAGAGAVEAASTLFRGAGVRGSAVALTDVHRLAFIVAGAADDGMLTSEERADIADALDMLWVRTDSFRHGANAIGILSEGQVAIADLVKVIERAEAMLAADGIGFAAGRGDFSDAVAEAQSSVTRWLEQTHHTQRTLLNRAIDRLRLLTALQIGFVFVILIFGSALMALLKREVQMRQTRNAAQARVLHLAYHDTLTGLPNRARFNERAAASFSELEGQVPQASLAFMDLDGFKAINDVHGHQVGDGVLVHVGEELNRLAAEQGLFVARLGGDEFAAILPWTDPARLQRFAATLGQRVNRMISVRGQPVQVRASLGLAAAPQVAAIGQPDPDMMSRAADFALYRAKEEGPAAQARAFDAQLAEEFGHRRALVAALETAVENGELEVWFQPKLTLATRTLCGFEALVRWRRGDRLVAPGEFVSLAEESGLILAIDSFMLRAATQAMTEWNLRARTRLPVSVNLSAQHLRVPSLFDEIRTALDASLLPAELLTLELTETVEVGDWDATGGVLDRVRDFGCRVSLDDFGTGYSSLAYLRRMPADELKLDKSFLTDIADVEEARWIVAAIVDIARSLRLDVVAEGIETEDQARVVAELGCDIGQGYLFGRPAPCRTAFPALRLPAPAGLAARRRRVAT